MKLVCLVVLAIAWLGGAGRAVGGLKDILEVQQDKTNDMAERLFNTKTIETRQFDANREFKVRQFEVPSKFQADRRFHPGGREITVREAEIFTGKARVRVAADGFERRSNWDGRKVEVPGRAPMEVTLNPAGERTYREAGLRYDGPELRRRTTELERMEQALRERESKEGRVLSMDEVKEILNKFE